jgi:hypothetical protein
LPFGGDGVGPGGGRVCSTVGGGNVTIVKLKELLIYNVLSQRT